MVGAVLVGSAVCCGAAEAPPQSLKVLAVGNSFSWSVMAYLPRVAAAAGCELQLEQASLDGCSLKQHWEAVERSEADPAYKPYNRQPYNESFAPFNLREKLESASWDVVTIQQASHDSWRPEAFEPYAENLIAYIHKYAPQAQVTIQQTWSYKPGEGRLAQWELDSTQMYERLTACYVGLAQRFALPILPTGLAVQIVRMGAVGTYPELDMIGPDKYHLSDSGQYLQACVWFSALFRRSAAEIAFVPESISAAQADFIRRCAQAAVEVMPQVAKDSAK